MNDLLLTISAFLQNLGDTFLSQSFWVKTAELLASLSILVFIHELGHYSWARLFGIKVEKFYLFFNPWLTLWKWKPKDKTTKFLAMASDDKEHENAEDEEPDDGKKSTWRDTEYGLGWLPLGGYCSIAGMIDETQGADKLAKPAKSWEFRSKPTWQRLFVMIGGVLNNFLLALVIYAGIVYAYGEEFVRYGKAAEGNGLYYSETAHKAGFCDGDIPLLADGAELQYIGGDEIKMVMAKEVQVLRDNDTVSIKLPSDFALQVNKDIENKKEVFLDWVPAVVKEVMNGGGAEKAGLKPADKLVAINNVPTPTFLKFTKELKINAGKSVTLTLMRSGERIDVNAMVDEAGKLGFQAQNDVSKLFETEKIEYSLLQSVPRGVKLGWDTMVSYVKSLKLVFTKEGAQSLGSFGAIGSMFPETWNWLSFWNITAFLSIILAVMNILPIPALDGGHVMFLLYEMVFRRPPSVNFMQRAQYVGMFLLLLLMVYAFGNDIYRFLIK